MSSAWRTIFWIYSAWFRFGGLLFAVLSAIVCLALAWGIARDGYILVDGIPDSSVEAIATAILTPFSGVLLGAGLYLFVPRVSRTKRPAVPGDRES